MDLTNLRRSLCNLLMADGNPFEVILAIGGNENCFDKPVREGIETINRIFEGEKIYNHPIPLEGCLMG